jgi:retron-type reverse transcriptase
MGERERGPGDLDDRFSKFIQKHGSLNAAWQAVKANSRASSSPFVQDEAQAFLNEEQTKIRSISARLQRGSYKFSKSRGVAIEKAGKPGKIRPIVISRTEDRVVQRSVLDALMSDDAIRSRAFQPNSFGGIPRKRGQEFSGVPAAIKALLDCIASGSTHVMIADIEGFFTRISKKSCVDTIKCFTDDKKFLDIFENAIAVDLENMKSIWRHKKEFPVGDIGVAQGNCLSPVLGNIILSDFDVEMNEGDCRCLRYIDDIIVIAPSGKAASARLRKASKLLEAKGMKFADDKTTKVPIQVKDNFEYLGIEFKNGKLRPSKKSRNSIIERAKNLASVSLNRIRTAKTSDQFDSAYSIPKTLNRLSGMAKGWAQHYSFCNDIQTILDVDAAMNKIYLAYAVKAQADAAKKNPQLSAEILGYSGASSVKFKPFDWPHNS